MSAVVLQNGHDSADSPRRPGSDAQLDVVEPVSPMNGLDSIFQSEPSPSLAAKPSKPLEENNGRPASAVKTDEEVISENENSADPKIASDNLDNSAEASADSQSPKVVTPTSVISKAPKKDDVLTTGCESLDRLFSTSSRRSEFVDQLINDILAVKCDTASGKSTGAADAINDNLKAFVLAVAGADVNVEALVSKIRDVLSLPDQIVIPPSEVVSIMSIKNFEPAETRSVDKPVSDSANSPCFPCPAMTSVLTDIGLNLVMESNSILMYEKVNKDITTNSQKLRDVSKRLDDLQMGAVPEDSDSDEEVGTIESSKALKGRLETSVKSLTNSKQVLRNNIVRLKGENRPFKLKLAKCSKCEFRSESLSVMYHHMLHPHKKLNRLECGFCDFRMANFDDLEAHYQSDHSLPCYEVLYPAKLACEFCPLDDFSSKGALKVHMRACAAHNPRHMNMAAVEDDLLHINRLFWGLNDTQLRRIQQKMFSRRPPQANQGKKLTPASGTPKGHGTPVPSMTARPMVAPRSGVSGASGLAGRPAELARQVNGASYHNILPKPNLPGAIPNYRQRGLPAALLAAQAAASAGQGSSLPLQLLSWQRNNLPALQRGRTPGATSSATAALMAAARANAAKAASHASASFSQQQQAVKGSGVHPQLGRQAAANTKAFHCEVCDEVQIGFRLYSVHLQQIHGKQMSGDQSAPPPLSCSKCVNQRFYSYEGLERHLLAVHNLVSQELLRKAREKKDSGRCKLCSKYFTCALVQHCATIHKMPLCTADIVYTCDICKAKFTVYAQLESHLANVHKRGARTAATLPRAPVPSSGTPSSAGNRSNIFSQATPAGAPAQIPRIRYNCTPCQLKFVSYGEVIEHWRVRHLKQFSVPVCRITDCEPCAEKRGLEPLRAPLSEGQIDNTDDEKGEPEAKRARVEPDKEDEVATGTYRVTKQSEAKDVIVLD